MEKLIQRCKNAKFIICYGIGDYAGHITTYLLDCGVEIDRYCVTDAHNEVSTFFGKSVDNVADIVKEHKHSLYILAADKIKRTEMRLLLCENGVNNIYDRIDDKWIDLLKKEAIHEWHFFLNTIIYNNPSYVISSTNHIYEKRIKQILDKYAEIEVRFFPVWHIAELVDEYIYYKEHFPHDYERFVLLYPMRPTDKISFKNKLNEVNGYLCSKMCGINFELITINNIDFWKYFIKKYREIFVDNRDRMIGKKISCLHSDMVRLGHYGQRRHNYIDFSAEDIAKGEQLLKEWGINKPYICLFSRDSLYYEDFLYDKKVPLSVRIMDDYRTSDIKNFVLTCDYMKEKNVKCVRMGVVSKNNFNHLNCVEYVNERYSSFMDLYLNANCIFYLGDASGALSMATLFDKPLALINYPMISDYDVELPLMNFVNRDLCIYQKYWHKKQNRFLTFSEMIDFETYAVAKTDMFRYNLTGIYMIYKNNNIVVKKNTSEEILDLAAEMYERLIGVKKYDAEDEELQQKYYAVIERANNIPGKHLMPVRVGSSYLKKNKWLLE